MVGCADCYEKFYDRLLPSIQRIHGRTKHVGRVPYTEVPDEKKPEAKKKELSTEEKIAKLQEDMQKAIDCQNFEQAAVIRDEIKELKGEK